jgi:hypothetical protein
MVETRPYDNIDYAPRIRDNYRMRRTSDADNGQSAWEDVIPQTGYDLPTRPQDWSTYDTFSPGVEDPVTRVSYARRRRPKEEDDDWAAVVAHDRFNNRDSNRWEMDQYGAPRTKKNAETGYDEYIPRDGWEDRSAAASTLVYYGGRASQTKNFNALHGRVLTFGL